MLVLNVFLAIAWAAISGQITVSNLLVGFLIGYVVLWFVSRSIWPSNYFRKFWQVIHFALFFLRELFVANLKVAIDIVTPRHLMKPAVLAIPIETRSAGETTTLANAVTLTPGTLSLDVSPDGKTLYVHVMYAEDTEAARRAIQEGMGRRVREVFE